MNILPDLKSPKFYRNAVVAAAVPGTVAYMLTMLLRSRLSEKEAADFDKQVAEYAKSENPVVSLDPHLDDLAAEDTLEQLGVYKKAGIMGAVGKTAAKVAGNAGELAAKHPRLSVFLAGSASVPATYGIYTGGSGAIRAVKNIGKPKWFTGRAEPGILLALAYLSALSGLSLGKDRSAKKKAENLEQDRRSLMNALEKSEYDRLHQLSDEDTYIESKLKDTVDGSVHKTAYTQADMLDSMMNMVKHKAIGPKQAALLAGAGALIPAGTWAAYKARNTAGTLAQFYPLVFTSLLLGGFGASKHLFDSQDLNRVRKKQLKKYLTQDMIENQSPAILEVGSDLPWEKARAAGGDVALDPEAGLPEDAEASEARTLREIRI